MRILTNAAWLSVYRIAAEVSSFLLFVVVARTFGPAGTGEYSYALAIGSLVAFAAGAGIDEFGMRQYAVSAQRMRAAAWANIVSIQYAQLLLAAIGLGAFLLAFGLKARVSIILETSALLVAQYLARTLFVPAMAVQSMRTPAVLEFGCRVAAFLGALVLIRVYQLPLPLALLTFPVMGGILIVLAARNAASHGAAMRPHFEYRRALSTARSTMPFTLAELLSQFYARTDILLIAYLLGTGSVGLYATDVKFVEVGILPIFLLGTAAYPALSRASTGDPDGFRQSAGEFAGLVLFLGGWLGVGIVCLAPLVAVAVFGSDFRPAIAYLHWFGVLAVVKGGEAALYRLMYATGRTGAYTVAMIVGVCLTVILDLALIPALGLAGAVTAAIVSVGAVVLLCAWNLRDALAMTMLLGTALRTSCALVGTFVIVYLLQRFGVRPWLVALAGCGAYPALGALAGLLPNPSSSSLFQTGNERIAEGEA